MPKAEEGRLLRYIQCGVLYAGSATNNGTFLPEWGSE